MPSSVKEGRVAKASKSASARPVVTIEGPKRTLKKREKSQKLLPLVERTNRLPLDQFIAYYLPPPALEIKYPDSTPEDYGPDRKEKLDYLLDIYTAHSLPAADFEACFRLIELTSSKDYSGSSIGWSPSKKRKEMKLPDMRYLLLHPNLSRERVTMKGGTAVSDTPDAAQSPNERDILGFVSFMVTYEDGKEVIYCYEIHLSPAVQGRGLGKLLMTRFEEIGRRIGLEKAMLTVFKSNLTALRLYERLGYSVDEYSPQPRTLRNGTVKEPDYLILSKPLQQTAT